MNLKQLLGICEHKWKIYAHGEIENENGQKIHDKIILQCEKCGKIKRKEL